MSIADQITRLQNAKASIKTSIENKGVSVGDDVKLDGYPALIDSIEVGGGSGEEVSSYWPNFFEFRTSKGTAKEYGNYLFADMNYMYGVATDNKNLIENMDVSNMTSMEYMFSFFNVSGIKDLNLTKWNVSKCSAFANMFDNSSFNSINISGWDFSGTTSLSSFFLWSSTKTVNMSNCNTSRLTRLLGCFQYSQVTSLDITGCDTSNVTNMNSIFYNSSITTITGSLDLSNLTNGFYPASYYSPLYGCSKLETLYLKNIYKNCTMTNASKWSINLGDTKVKDECLIYIINELPDLVNDKGLTATDQIILTLPPTNTLTAEQVKVATDKGWTCANTTY